jgi:hypothetical protein
VVGNVLTIVLEEIGRAIVLLLLNQLFINVNVLMGTGMLRSGK